MNTPAIDILGQKKEAWLGTAATGLAGLGALHGAATGAAAMRPPGALPMTGLSSLVDKAQWQNLGVQAAGVPRQFGGALRGATTGAIAPFVGLTKAIGGGIMAQPPGQAPAAPAATPAAPGANQLIAQRYGY